MRWGRGWEDGGYWGEGALGVPGGRVSTGGVFLKVGRFEGVAGWRAGLAGLVTWVHDASVGKYGMLFSGKLSFSVVQRFLNSWHVHPQLA